FGGNIKKNRCENCPQPVHNVEKNLFYFAVFALFFVVKTEKAKTPPCRRNTGRNGIFFGRSDGT
ncbi:MAG: hypothetical protein II621_07755, partial [Clostridia bacterium]|nr:hypothetical protein [Clostridia bacterium]